MKKKRCTNDTKGIIYLWLSDIFGWCTQQYKNIWILNALYLIFSAGLSLALSLSLSLGDIFIFSLSHFVRNLYTIYFILACVRTIDERKKTPKKPYFRSAHSLKYSQCVFIGTSIFLHRKNCTKRVKFNATLVLPLCTLILGKIAGRLLQSNMVFCYI